MAKDVNLNSLKSEIRMALINSKVNACPIASRLAWHASGTFDKSDGSGGSNGATIRFAPESTDGANAGLLIIRELLHPVKVNHPEVSHADLFALAGAMAIEFLGGPNVPVKLGRTDDVDGARCPANGRLPDASQGADHLRSLFGHRMGFTDREIVALSGAHTMGRCHRVRSGFDGPWTTNPLHFDNEYFRNLLELEWVPKVWDGPLQYTDTKTGDLMMLPTDLALVQDATFKSFVELYARDESAFFRDFASAFAKLLALGCPAHVQPDAPVSALSARDQASANFREYAMHGSVGACRKIQDQADVHALESSSGRSALHKAAFWGHTGMVKYLTQELKLDVDLQDEQGDTPLHESAKFGHLEVVKDLLAAGARTSVVNKAGDTPLALALRHDHPDIAALLQA